MGKLLFFTGFLILFNIRPAECTNETAAAAGNVVPAQELITQMLPYPDAAYKANISEEVCIILNIDGRGLITVLAVNSPSPMLEEYVKTSLNGKVLHQKTEAGVVILKLNYRLM